jgi:hypothetical protein
MHAYVHLHISEFCSIMNTVCVVLTVAFLVMIPQAQANKVDEGKVAQDEYYEEVS